MNSFTRWIRSKQGMTILGIAVVLVLIVAIVLQQAGLLGTAGGVGRREREATETAAAAIDATATAAALPTNTPAPVPPTSTPELPPPTATTPPLAQFATPKDGQTCLPSCFADDAKFLSLMGQGASSFGGNKIYLWIAVPGSAATFDLKIFDGDSGSGTLGPTSLASGNWDGGSAGTTTYTLYADPEIKGAETTPVASWQSTAMPNNQWWQTTLNVDPQAVGKDGYYYYMFKAEQPAGATSSNEFKVASSGFLSGGRGDMVGTSLGLRGGAIIKNDVALVFPALNGDYTNPGPSKYDGEWTLFFYVAPDTTRLELWDGDFDRGTSATEAQDTDDTNTDGVPQWAVAGATVPERAGGQGNPKDNASSLATKVGDPAYYEVFAPGAEENSLVLLATNKEPSGTEEWESYVISTKDDPNNATSDLVVDSLPAGDYIVKIHGLDGANTIWFYTKQEVCDNVEGCGGKKIPTPTPLPTATPEPPPCTPDNYNIGGGAAIIALNPDGCQGQQNGLLFHGTSSTTIEGNAYSAGCLRSVGTHSVKVTNGEVQYIGEGFGDMTLIDPAPKQITQPLSIEQIPAPDCTNPAAHNVDAKSWEGADVNLDAGLYCVTGDVRINAGQKFMGKEVTIYLVNGSLTINGGATVQLTAPWSLGDNPAVAPAIDNVLFYVPDANGADPAGGQRVEINGNSDSYFEGVLYAPGSEVNVLGTGQVMAPFRSQFIGWDVRIGGTADVFISWKGYNLPDCVK